MKKKVIIPPLGILIGLLASLSLAGCWTSVIGSHPLVQENLSIPHARVYFIRPNTERFMGMADNRVTVLLDQQPMIHLVKGEYTLTHLLPGQTWISVENLTTFGPTHKVKQESRNRSFTFVAGVTYYIAINPIDGEFRGVHFIPMMLAPTEAQEMTQQLRSVGG